MVTYSIDHKRLEKLDDRDAFTTRLLNARRRGEDTTELLRNHYAWAWSQGWRASLEKFPPMFDGVRLHWDADSPRELVNYIAYDMLPVADPLFVVAHDIVMIRGGDVDKVKDCARRVIRMIEDALTSSFADLVLQTRRVGELHAAQAMLFMVTGEADEVLPRVVDFFAVMHPPLFRHNLGYWVSRHAWRLGTNWVVLP